MDCSKGVKAVVLEGCEQGAFGESRKPRILSKTAGARGETYKFLQRLNRMACIDG
jgi:hypothetical protein